MEATDTIYIIIGIAILIAIIIAISNYIQKANIISFIEKKTKQLFKNYTYDNDVIDLNYFSEVEANTLNILKTNLEKEKAKNPEKIKVYFDKVNIDEWVASKTYDIIVQFHDKGKNFTSNEKNQYTVLLQYLQKELDSAKKNKWE